MPLHSRDAIREDLLDDVYASDDISVALRKYTFPKNEHDPRRTYQAVHDELMLDGNSRQNLATFCQTWVDEETHKLMDASIDKNMIDKDEYPQTAELEARCVHMLADLWRSPDAENTLGCSTTGSSEAAMLGGLAMKWTWRKKRKAAGLSTDKPNLICGPVQICWHKFARYFDVELREIPMEHGRLIMSPEEVIKRADENTIGVVSTLGVTFTCEYEPVQAVHDALDRLQKEKGLDVPIHVDGASGGFLAPFCSPDLPWDFRLPRVVSINASGHKFGLAPLGVGWVVWRDAKHLPEELIFKVNYLGGEMPTFALNFSRPGGQIVAHQACRSGFCSGLRRACSPLFVLSTAELGKTFETLRSDRIRDPAFCAGAVRSQSAAIRFCLYGAHYQHRLAAGSGHQPPLDHQRRQSAGAGSPRSGGGRAAAPACPRRDLRIHQRLSVADTGRNHARHVSLRG